MRSRQQNILVVSRTRHVATTVREVCSKLSSENLHVRFDPICYESVVHATVMIETGISRKYSYAVVELSDSQTEEERVLLQILRRRRISLIVLCASGSRTHLQLDSDPHVAAIVHEADPTAAPRILGKN